MGDRQNNNNNNRPNYLNHQTRSSSQSSSSTTNNNNGRRMGFQTLAVSGGILLLLTGATVTSLVLTLAICTPIIVVTSPIWVPIGLVLGSIAVAFLTFCALSASAIAGVVWGYRYLTGFGSERVDTVKEYVIGGYIPNKPKDAAPGA